MLALFSTKVFPIENNAAILTPLSFFLFLLFLSFYFCSFIFSSYLSDEIEAIIQRHYPNNYNLYEEIYACVVGLYGHETIGTGRHSTGSSGQRAIAR